MHLFVTALSRRSARLVGVATLMLWAVVGVKPAAALDTLCDSSFQNCRTQLIQMIDNEDVAIDVAMWFMEDGRYASALIRAKQRGVAIRVLMDPQSNEQHPVQSQILTTLSNTRDSDAQAHRCRHRALEDHGLRRAERSSTSAQPTSAPMHSFTTRRISTTSTKQCTAPTIRRW